MAFGNIYDIAASGMRAQSLRMNTTASNVANAQSVAGEADQVYKAKHPVFKAVQAEQNALAAAINGDMQSASAVEVDRIAESQAEPLMRYEPNHPLANEEGYIYQANINVVEEMANMISASRSFQINVEVMNSAKSMAQSVLTLGK